MKNTKKPFGFTLLELLIVISIVGILASISFVALNGARQQGRDGRRKADLETVRSALELYRADCNSYPAALPAVGTSLTGNTAPCTIGAANIYLRKIPADPSGSTFGNYSYTPLPAGGPYTSYTLCSKSEDVPAYYDNSGCGSCGGSPATCHYKVENP